MARAMDTHSAERTLSTRREKGGSLASSNVARLAVGYVRVSTDMQASEGLSLEAQHAAIEGYCALHGIKLLRICKDVMSGGKDQRPGLQEALSLLQNKADILIVLKFDRLSRSIKHFCNLYEHYFKSGEKELVAIRESIRLDSSLGRALVGILLVFAQMEREATGERTCEAVRHIRALGYHFGKVPYGKLAVPAPDNPRFRVLVDEPHEQAVLVKIKQWSGERRGPTEIADLLNAEGISPPQGEQWTKSLIYNLMLRLRWISPRPVNQRPHTDQEVKQHILDLRSRGHTVEQIAHILNEQNWVPLKGKKTTTRVMSMSAGMASKVALRTAAFAPAFYVVLCPKEDRNDGSPSGRSTAARRPPAAATCRCQASPSWRRHLLAPRPALDRRHQARQAFPDPRQAAVVSIERGGMHCGGQPACNPSSRRQAHGHQPGRSAAASARRRPLRNSSFYPPSGMQR